MGRQIWMARFEYWVRRFNARKAVNATAKVEWAYIKERIAQPMTWTGQDMQHFGLWLLNVLSIHSFIPFHRIFANRLPHSFALERLYRANIFMDILLPHRNGHHQNQSLFQDSGMFMIHLRTIHLTISRIILQNNCN